MWTRVILVVLLSGLTHSIAYNFEVQSIPASMELCKVVLYICERHFSQRTSSLAISAEVTTKQARYYSNDFMDQFFKSIDNLKIKYEVFNHRPSKSWDFFNVILVDSAESFRKINPGAKTKEQDYSEFYLVVLKAVYDADYSREMESIFAYCWRYYIINVSLVYEDSFGLIRMFTYFPFTKNECFSTAAVELGVNGRDFEEIFPPKMSSLHNCRLVGAFWNVPPYLSFNRRASGLERFEGIEGHLLRELAEKMNFSIDSITPPNDEQRGLVYKNGTVSGAIKLEKTAHFSLGCFRCTQQRSTVLSPSQSFYQTMQVFTVKARTEPWTTFEIITYPFDFYIWTVMLIIIIVAISLSIGLQENHPRALCFIFGARSSANALNIVAAWLGSPVVPEPKRNFARFLLSLWLFVALILRNSYQGLLFNFLHSNLVKLPPDTSQQLADRHYTLIVNLASNDTFSGVPIIRDGHLNVLVKNITDGGGYPLLEETNGNFATATPKDFLSYYVMTTKKYGVYHVLKETIFAQQMCIYFTKHSFLTARVNEVLMNLRSFGLIELWASQYLDDSFIELKESEPNTGIPMSMSQLKGVFQILLVLLLTAAIVFMAELLSGRILLL